MSCICPEFHKELYSQIRSPHRQKTRAFFEQLFDVKTYFLDCSISCTDLERGQSVITNENCDGKQNLACLSIMVLC